MQTRRLIAVAVVIVIVIVMALLIHGCEVSQTNSSLKTYNAEVDSLITASDNHGAAVFAELASGDLNAANVGTLQTKLDSLLASARADLDTAESFSAPGQMSAAQNALVQVMQLRYDGISQIAGNVQSAASRRTSKDAIYQISVGTSLLYSSDVLYKTFVTPGLARALNGAGIPIGSGGGQQQINAGQVVPDLGWLQSTFIAAKTGAPLSTAAANVNNAGPGVHGHSLNSVSVGATTLSTAGPNSIQASPAPTFTLSLTNGGTTNEYQVECKVSVKGLSDVGTSTIAETTPGQTTTCSVTLPSPPIAGTFQVTAEVVKVPGEKNIANNFMTFPVTFN